MLRRLGWLSLVCGIVAALQLAACVRLGYEATTEPSPLDGAAADHFVPKDSSRREGLADSLQASMDTSQPPKDLGGTDTGSICSEPKEINDQAATCSSQCITGKVPDADCDGLRDVGQDPWTASCNRLLFADEFLAPPKMPTWNASSGVTWTCGKAGVHAGDYLMLSDTSSLANASYMAEIRVGIMKTVGPGSWRASLITAVSADVHYSCELRTTNGQDTIHLERYGAGGCAGTAVSSFVPAVTIGQPYLLQSYHDGVQQTCRLLSSSGQVIKDVTISGCAPSSPGTVKVTATDCDIAVSYVRIFQVN